MGTVTLTHRFEGFHRLKPINTDPQNLTVDLNWLWDQVKTQDYAFDDFSRGNVESFCQMLMDPTNRFFLIEDHGLFMVRNVLRKGNADIHFIVWDRNFSLHRDKAPTYELFDWLFYDQLVHRITGYIPAYNILAARYALAMAMRYEGELQEAVLWKGEFHNVKIFGLLEGWYRNRREIIK